MQANFLENLPRAFTGTITGAFGEKGKIWLENLPEIIREIERKWSVSVEKHYPNLSYHYVAPCILAVSGFEYVVKISFPGEAQTNLGEMQTLKFLDGACGAVKLFEYDEKLYAMLLEKIEPGENLKTVFAKNKAAAVEVAIDSMRKFWREPPENHQFPTLENWFKGLKRAAEINFATEYTSKALRFFEELNSDPARHKLLHGDFHHENILRSAKREKFLVIDPKGIVGDIGYDVTVFLINHANWLRKTCETEVEKKLDETIRRFSEAFVIEDLNLRKWTFAQSVLSAYWTFEENDKNWKKELAKSEIWKV